MLRGQWSAPANLLLAGEYAVTRPGGTGISVALSPRGRLDLHEEVGDTPGMDRSAAVPPGSPVYRGLPPDTAGTGMITVTATMGGAASGTHGKNPTALVEGVVDAVLAGTGCRIDRTWWMEVDTTRFFHASTGKKLGLGSSAVATLLLTAALLEIIRLEKSGSVGKVAGGPAPADAKQDAPADAAPAAPPEAPEAPEALEQTIRAAIEAHRAVHGGRGSGYDIVTSAVGGSVRFVGGVDPQWTAVPFLSRLLDNGFTLHTWNNAPPVASGSAVGCFDTVVPPHSDAEKAFLRQNNTIVDTMERAESWKSLFTAFQKAAQLGRDLGTRIGVSAELPHVGSHVDDGWISKASGAGNERAVIVAVPAPRRMLPRGAAPVTPELRGLTCLYRNTNG
jgi:mevalonate kinase